jgi:hypothetical protein
MLPLALLLTLLVSSEQANPPVPGAPDPNSDGITVLDTVLVSGVQPGPGLWRVRSGEHSLWVLGSLTPLPRRLQWTSTDVEAKVRQSTVVLAPPAVRFDAGVGRVRGLFLLPSLLAARRNPGDATLADVLPGGLYERWQPLRQHYLPRARDIERWRPLFAAQRLFEVAVERSGLRFRPVTWPVVERTAKRLDITIVNTTVEVRIEAPRTAIREFAREPLDDVRCFELTIDRLEADLAAMRERANAWSVGDLDTLRALPFVDQAPACIEAVLNASVIADRGYDDLPERVRAAWMAAAEAALAEHRTGFAVLPMRHVLAADGYLAALRTRGYLVETPDEISEPDDPAAEVDPSPAE